MKTSLSISVEASDSRARHWAKLVTAETALQLPSATSRADQIPGQFLLEGEEELAAGDFLIQGEQVHHRHPERGWGYRLTYMGIDGELQVVSPTKENKQALKAAGMALEFLKGAGELAACVRIIHGLRAGLSAGVVPIETSVVPVTMADYAEVFMLREAWFVPSAGRATPTPWQIYEQAKFGKMTVSPEVIYTVELADLLTE